MKMNVLIVYHRIWLAIPQLNAKFALMNTSWNDTTCIKCMYPCKACGPMLHCLSCVDLYIYNDVTDLCEKCTVNHCVNCSNNKA